MRWAASSPACETLGGAAQGLGLLAAGLLVEHVDVVTILNGQATVYIVCGLIGLVFLGRVHRRGRRAGPQGRAAQ